MLSAQLEHVDSGNLDEARRVIAREYWWLKGTEIDLFMQAWTRIDPAAAVDYARRWPHRPLRKEAMAAALRGWALHDPEAVAGRFDALVPPSSRHRQELAKSMLIGWVESGKPGAIEHVASGPAGAWPYHATTIAGAQTRLLGVPGVIEWAEGVVTSDLPIALRRDLFRRVTGMASRGDPRTVAAWVEAHANREYASGAPRLLAERWVTQDPYAAIQWVSKFVPADDRTAILLGAFSKWLVADFDAAAAWIESVPPVLQNDPAYAAYARVLTQRDAVAARPWAERVHDEKLRQDALEWVASGWYQRDPSAAEIWLEESPLGEDARERVREARNRPRLRPLEGL